MCGVIGYIGEQNCLSFLINGLKRVEYRGYDSAGVFLTGKDKKSFYVRSVGQISFLEQKLTPDMTGTVGIGHTRWATHGEPNETNAHPHHSNDGTIYLIHNGIIENYLPLKRGLEKKGYHFYSDTDTEILVNLIQEYYRGDLESAVRNALNDVEGTYGIGVISTNEPDKIVVARLGSPLLIGVGENENYFASDAASLLGKTRDVIYMDDGDMAVLTKDSIMHKNINNTPVDSKIERILHDIEAVEKGGYPHFMLKEIFDQPKTITDSLRGRLLPDEGTVKLGGLMAHPDVYKALVNAKKIYIIACGTSWHSGLIGEYMLEEYCRIPVEVEYSSEFRYRDPIIEPGTVVIAISQSGETADTLAAMREAKRKGAYIIGICNVVGSTIAKESDAGIFLHVGPEIGVASTKAFTSQVVVLSLLTIDIARQKNMSFNDGYKLVKDLAALPKLIQKILDQAPAIEELSKKFSNINNAIYLGRGYNFPVALEGALKLKEISYIHAEGYPAAEMKHGPIALIDENMPVVVIATKDAIYDKVVSNIKEVKARRGIVIAIASDDDHEIKEIADFVITVPHTTHMLLPILNVIPLQLLAYYQAVQRGCNVDMPRNLAKSVTVE